MSNPYLDMIPQGTEPAVAASGGNPYLDMIPKEHRDASLRAMTPSDADPDKWQNPILERIRQVTLGGAHAVAHPIETAGNIWEGVKGAAMLPGDVYSGAADLNDPETFNKALELGFLSSPGAIGGRAPAALKASERLAGERAASVKALEQEGVPVTAGQATGSKNLQKIESTLAEMPGATQKAKEIVQEQKQAFAAAALKRAGSEESKISDEVLTGVKGTLGKSYEDIAARNKLILDKTLATDVTKALGEYEARLSPSLRAPGVKGIVDDILNHSITGEPMAGEAYSAIRSDLAKTARDMRSSDPRQSKAYHDVYKALDRAMTRSIMKNNPKDVGAWEKLNKQYAAYKTIDKAYKGTGGEAAAEGGLSPARLRQAAYDRNPELLKLARAGEHVMTPLPNSGTPAGANIMHLLTTGGGALTGGLPGMMAGMAAPAVASRALMSKPVQAHLKRRVIKTKFGTFPRTKAGRRALAAAMSGKAALIKDDQVAQP